MEIRYELYDGLPAEPLLSSLLTLHLRVFSGQTSEALLLEFGEMKSRGLVTILALDDDRVIGYKMGYPRKPAHFYSWLGCVSPDYRRRGIAGELMRRQHDWCRAGGFHTIRTHTRNQWRDMLILNLRYDFNVIGTIANTGHVTIILEKELK